MNHQRPVPTATYRLQMNQDFRFQDAAALTPYLDALGVSHLYSSPCLKTRAGSSHGYDIIDHNSFNPDLGEEADFDRLVEGLRARDMGLILDIVPNHMGVGSDNVWWMDVLEHGEASQYANYFDIDWNPNNRLLRGKLLLPTLGDYYGEVLERQELQLCFEAETGSFHVAYYEHRFPIDPRTYVHILAWRLEELDRGTAVGEESLAVLRALIERFRALPRRSDASRYRKQQRREMAEACKRELAELCHERPALADWLRELVGQINGHAGDSASFDRLHRLLQSQAYRLAYWKVAADEINYRRFFDINDLAGLRMEDEKVFQATHRLIASLAMQGRIDGVRIDHVDGLADPATYCARLQRLLNGHQDGHCLIYLEKILARDEELRDWPVQGTTGYEFGALANGLFVQPEAEQPLSALYDQFALAGQSAVLAVPAESRVVVDFDELLYHSKRFIIQYALSGELSVLTNLLSRIAQADRHTRDFTYNSLRNAISEVVACFPVYRTYITPRRIEDPDRAFVARAIEHAQRRRKVDQQILDFVHRVLTVTPRALNKAAASPELRRHMAAFCLRFQQYTSMVEAKGLEDTAGYRYHRLISLNEVGANPCAFSVDVAEFHEANRRRLEHWPQALLSTSTHDSKRSEDVRMRVDVLSEVAEEWGRHVLLWRELNRGHKRRVDEREIPSANDEYLLYQTLFGAWPLEQEGEGGLDGFRQRVADFMPKAVREAKLYTSWANPDSDYEDALGRFVAQLLAPGSAFLDDFLPFLQRYSRYGLLNALSQTLLKLTVPGVPDIYQGNESFVFNLVDPDNRRPVDFARRQRQLEELRESFSGGDRRALLRDLQSALADGRAKLFLNWRCLQLRRRRPAVFSDGEYMPLRAEGTLAEHLIAFARRHEDCVVLVVACRWFARLDRGERRPDGQIDWGDTRVLLTPDLRGLAWRDELAGEPLALDGDAEHLSAQELFATFPLCLLESVAD